MTQPAYGLVFNEQDDDPRPAQPSDLSIIGIVLPRGDADSGFFPLDEPVVFDSADPVWLAKVGTGDIAHVVNMIDDQLADMQTSARIVCVAVANDADPDQQIANIIGSRSGTSSGSHIGTGLYALLRAGTQLGVVPRLIASPGYTGRHGSTVAATNVSEAAKSGGNTGAGVLTLANPAFGGSVKAGVYQVRCIGGAKSASSAAKGGGNTGNGTMGSLSTDADSAVGAWRVVCEAAATNGGVFVVYRPDGTFDGVATVGAAYNSAHGPNFTIADGATDFVVGDEFVVTVAASVPANGGDFSVTDPDGNALAVASVGVAYTGAHIKFTIADGSPDFVIGDGFDVTVAITAGAALANAVCAALPAVLASLLANGVVGSSGTSQADSDAWAETISDERLIRADATAIVQDGGSTAQRDGAAIALGLFARVDFKHEGIPAWSISGQPVQGILGLKNNYPFSLVDGANAGQELLANHICIVERGETGVETAAAGSGFIWLGVWNASNDPLKWFYNKRRMRDWTHLALLKSIRLRLGVENVTPQGVEDVLNDMKAIGSYLIQKRAVVGFKVGFEAARNSADSLRQGQFTVSYAQEEPAPIVGVTIDSRPYYEALTVELATLVAQAQTLSPQFLS